MNLAKHLLIPILRNGSSSTVCPGGRSIALLVSGHLVLAGLWGLELATNVSSMERSGPHGKFSGFD